MRLAVVGTSNAVMPQGYRSFLHELDVAEVESFSLGGMPNVILPYRIPRIPADWHDVVLIDTFVNDLWCVCGGFMTRARACGILADTMAYLVGRGARIALLLLPTDDASLDHVSLRAEYIAIAALYGAVVVDGYEVSQALLDTGLPARLVFRDAGHLNPRPSLLVAHRVADALLALPERVAAVPVEYPYATHPVPAATIERGTSLMRGHYAQLRAGECVSFRFDEPRELLALSLNEANSSAFVEITTGQARVVKDLRLAKPVETTMRHSLTPLVGVVAGAEITLRVVPAPEGSFERSSHSVGGAAAGMLELEAVVTRRQAAPAAALPDHVPSLRPTPKLSRWERGEAVIMRLEGNQRQDTRLLHELGSLFGGARDFSLYECADLLRDVGRLAIAAGEPEVARNVLTHALRQRPGGVFIQELLSGL